MYKPTLHLATTNPDLNLQLTRVFSSTTLHAQNCHVAGIAKVMESDFLRKVIKKVAKKYVRHGSRRAVVRNLAQEVELNSDPDRLLTDLSIPEVGVVARFVTRQMDEPEFWEIYRDFAGNDLLPSSKSYEAIVKEARDHRTQQLDSPAALFIDWMVSNPSAYKIVDGIRSDLSRFPSTPHLNFFLGLASALAREEDAHQISKACVAQLGSSLESEALRI